jgi:hypothetical protein
MGSYLKSSLSFWYLGPHLFALPKSSWIISVELAIGPEEGISYLTDKGCNVSWLLGGHVDLVLGIDK